MDNISRAAQAIAEFLQLFTSAGELRLRFRVKARGAKPAAEVNPPDAAAGDPDAAVPSGEKADESRNLYVEFTGPDTPVLTARNGDVLNALEHIAAQILRLKPEENDRLSFDADHFKANREREMRAWAGAAIERVLATGRPHSFPAMSSRERRMLHMMLSDSGLPTASSGEGPQRFVVLYPKGADTSQPVAEAEPQRRRDPSGVRNAFRHR